MAEPGQLGIGLVELGQRGQAGDVKGGELGPDRAQLAEVI